MPCGVFVQTKKVIFTLSYSVKHTVFILRPDRHDECWVLTNDDFIQYHRLKVQ